MSFIYRALSSYFVRSCLNLVYLFIFFIHSILMYILTSSCIFSLSFFQFPLLRSILVHNAFLHSFPLSPSNFIGLYDYPLSLLYAYSSSCIFFSHVCCLCHLSMKLNVHKNLSSGNGESWWAKKWKWVQNMYFDILIRQLPTGVLCAKEWVWTDKYDSLQTSR